MKYSKNDIVSVNARVRIKYCGAVSGYDVTLIGIDGLNEATSYTKHLVFTTHGDGSEFEDSSNLVKTEPKFAVGDWLTLPQWEIAKKIGEITETGFKFTNSSAVQYWTDADWIKIG